MEEAQTKDRELERVVEEDPGKERRRNYFEFASYGHRKLIAFLIDPENYQQYIGKDLELVAVDFREDIAQGRLFEKYKDRIASLKKHLEENPEEAEVIDFVDSWLRCDMVFRKKAGGYVVVEVKQNAVDRKIFQNATKASQQLAAYIAVILDNIQRKNMQMASRKRYRPIKESVEGCLVAYRIDELVTNHLNKAGNKGAITIQRKVVDGYIGRLLEPQQ